MKLSQLKELMDNGRITSVTFIRRSDGRERTMVCRTRVAKGVKGDKGLGPAYDPDAKGLLPVFEMSNPKHPSGHYRTIPAEGVLRVKSGPRVYDIEKEL